MAAASRTAGGRWFPRLVTGLFVCIHLGTGVAGEAGARQATDSELAALVQTLKDTRNQVRCDTVRAIGVLGPRAVPAADVLIDAIRAEYASRDWGLREWCVVSAASDALSAMGPAVIPRLLAALPDERPTQDEGVVAIVGALSRIGRPAVEHLVALLNSSQETVNRKVGAINALGGMDTRDAAVAIPALRNAVRHRNTRVSDRARSELNRQGVSPHGETTTRDDHARAAIALKTLADIRAPHNACVTVVVSGITRHENASPHVAARVSRKYPRYRDSCLDSSTPRFEVYVGPISWLSGAAEAHAGELASPQWPRYRATRNWLGRWTVKLVATAE